MNLKMCLLVLSLVCASCFKRPEKLDKKVSFSIILGSCFANDTFSLSVDDNLLVNKLPIQSDTVLGLASL